MSDRVGQWAWGWGLRRGGGGGGNNGWPVTKSGVHYRLATSTCVAAGAPETHVVQQRNASIGLHDLGHAQNSYTDALRTVNT